MSGIKIKQSDFAKVQNLATASVFKDQYTALISRVNSVLQKAMDDAETTGPVSYVHVEIEDIDDPSVIQKVVEELESSGYRVVHHHQAYKVLEIRLI